jgi:hypothetical protein
VSLPVSQQRVLVRIERDLKGCEPRLVSMFAIFARLTSDEEVPRTESLPSRTSLRRPARTNRLRRPARTVTLQAIIAVPLMLGLVALLIFLTVSSSAAHACRPSPAPRVATCQSAFRLQDHSPAG